MGRGRLGRALIFCGLLATLAALVALLPDESADAGGGVSLGLFPDEPEVRVLLARRGPGDVLRLGADPVRLRDATRQLLPGAGPHEIVVLDAENARIAGHEMRLPLRITALTGGGVPLLEGHYPGTIVLLPGSGRIAVVNVVPVETYLEGVIFPEMGSWFPDEALEAQVVASRSYALYEVLRRDSRPWHLRADQRSQVYRGFSHLPHRARRLVASTRAMVLAWQGHLVPGYFSSTCGGGTRAAEEAFGGEALPPLAGVPCEYCRRAPLAHWTSSMPLDALRQRLGWRDPILGVGALERRTSGRLVSLTLLQAGESHAVSLLRLRRAWPRPLPSSWITAARVKGAELELKGRGHGHGVGLCQYGARTLALAGRGHVQILEHFFPGARLVPAWPASP